MASYYPQKSEFTTVLIPKGNSGSLKMYGCPVEFTQNLRYWSAALGFLAVLTNVKKHSAYLRKT